MACSLPGYYGSSCNISCAPGTFGRHCAGNCSGLCPIENCHPVFGCLLKSSSVPQTTELDCKPGYFGSSCDIPCPSGCLPKSSREHVSQTTDLHVSGSNICSFCCLLYIIFIDFMITCTLNVVFCS
ncbi:uncharacterized protein LOC111100157 [Crassostrea virginica]